MNEGSSGIRFLRPRASPMLSPDAVAFVADLARTFSDRVHERLAARRARHEAFARGELPHFLPETRAIREGDWKVAPLPADLLDRRVEITGPVERKMIINALNSGASCFMADFEDANAPTWANIVLGQVNLIDAIERTIELEVGDKTYRLGDEVATLLARPRGWHLPEKHALIGGEPVSASLFDAGLFLFHNGRRLLEHGSGPYLYLPN